MIAAITSCTNTSNPAVMLAAGLLAKKAVERGLSVKPWVKTSLAPGSRVVSEYLNKTGLQPFLDQLGFNLVGFGCTTCIGNSGPLDRELEEALTKNDIIAASVLSGNRNFEARIHQSVKANFLMSPPLVVAFAIAGRIDIDLTREPLAVVDGREVYLRDVWPSMQEIDALLGSAFDPAEYRRVYADFADQNPLWNQIPAGTRAALRVGPGFALHPRAAVLRSVDGGRAVRRASPARGRSPSSAIRSRPTTSARPARSSRPRRPATTCATTASPSEDFNSYGARRGNHEVMVRGTFANVRIRNLMVPGVEGGITRHQPDGERMGIYDAAERYRAEGVPLIVIAGQDYGAGSSRDWAAKGTRLLGVRAVIARGFERIHRSNLIGMGVLPCQFPEGVSAQTLGLDGTERFDLEAEAPLRPRQPATLHIERRDGRRESVPLVLRIDTPIEAAYFSAGGILPYVLEQLLAQKRSSAGANAMIRIKRTYDPPARGDGRRILVERLWPRGMKKEALAADAWMKEVAPSTELRKWFDHRVERWEEFRRRYRKELRREPGRWEPILDASSRRHGDPALQRPRHPSQRRRGLARLSCGPSGQNPTSKKPQRRDARREAPEREEIERPQVLTTASVCAISAPTAPLALVASRLPCQSACHSKSSSAKRCRVGQDEVGRGRDAERSCVRGRGRVAQFPARLRLMSTIREQGASKMKVADLMTQKVACVRADEPLSSAARLMWDCDCGAVPVIDGTDRVVGMITDRDICMATWSRDQAPSGISVDQAMSEELHQCSPDASVATAENLMRSKQVRRIPVVDENQHLAGILSLADIARSDAIAGTRAASAKRQPDEIAATLARICQPPAAVAASS